MRAVELFVALGMIVTMAKAIWPGDVPERTARVCAMEPIVEGPVAPDSRVDYHPFCL